jgi:hypothetical protein
VTHPSPGALLELLFDEAPVADRESLSAHVRGCGPCGAYLDEVRRLARALAPAGPDDEPPSDGLERVLARVAAVQPARTRRAEWARTALPGAATLLAGGWAMRAGAERLAASGVLPAPLAGSLAGDALAWSLSAFAVVCVGAFVTLAFAPVLILESRRS